MAWRDASATNCSRRLVKNGSAPTMSAPTCSWTREEGGVDLAFAAGFQEMELQPLHSCRLLYLLNDTLGSRVVRVHQQGDHPSPRNQLRKQLKPLSRQPLVAELADPREVAARPGEAGDQPVRDRIAAMPEDDRDRRGRAFRG